jgi:pimeloyl-ACP methyl ester carboxylesterase
MEKITIKNRKGQKIVVLLEQEEKQKGLAFIIHGLSGNKEQPHIAIFAQSFKDKGFTVVRFDTTNTFGESDGRYEDATVTTYFEDLEDVISWAKLQVWYQEPFYLAGHSLGGISVILYAEKYPQEVKGIAPIATVVSGELSLQAEQYRKSVETWRKTGWRITKISGHLTRLPWSHMVDRLRYDVFSSVKKLTMPVLMIVGDHDISTPLVHQQMLFDKLSGEKELHVITGSSHTFTAKEYLIQIKEIFEKWIDKVEKV